MPPITEDEKLRRRKSIASVLGTHEMEGMFADQPTLDIMRRYTEGEFSPEQFSDAMDAYAHSLIRTHALAGAA